ncbi:hypothetical protein LSH36_465g01000 [Paralvinella palmiformis]|uniref:3CxxC-type domain-containing protein n=1 Tax=Paralvinella palmiformis TaxID=53620 RepID=A0AAD9J9S9_9ANNE|nr:hypothetical protein LSH36_465g01000 [Paralvinella palmiformis]
MMPPTLYTTIPMNAPLPGANPTCTWIPQQQGGVSTALNTACAAPYQPPMLYPDMVNVAVGQVGQAVVPPASTSPMKPMYHMSVTMCMEVVWHGEFDRLFQTFPDSWTLGPTTAPPVNSQFSMFQDSAKVRFSCQNCSRAWTSMKGRVGFWFHLERDTQKGEVLFKLYGQQCQRCPNADFSHAMWYPEEVVKVIENLYNRIGTVHYGFVLPPIRIDRRTGKPRAQHDSKLCQACKDGICQEGWTLK